MFSVSLRKIIFGLGLMLLSSAAFSFSLSDYNGRCGNTRIQLGPAYGKYAIANIYANTITIDPITVRMLSPRAIEFVFFHECGHIKHRHTPEAAYDATRKQHNENEADCYAANRFRRTHGEDQLSKALRELEPINGKIRNINIQQCE